MSSDQHWAPARIWLQRGVGEEGSHTWCEDQIGDEVEEAAYVSVGAGGEPRICCNIIRSNPDGACIDCPRQDDRQSEAAVCEPIYQLQNSNGSWIDQDESQYRYNSKYGWNVRIVYHAPPPASTNRLTGSDIASIHDEIFGNAGYSAEQFDAFARAIIAATEAK